MDLIRDWTHWVFPLGIALALLWKGRRKPDTLFMAILWTVAEIRAAIDFQSGFYGYAIVGIAAVTAACLPGLLRLLNGTRASDSA